MKAQIVLLLALLGSSVALADDHAYLEFDQNGNLVASGPFDAIIPAPEGFQRAEPLHTSPQFMGETLQMTKAGFHNDDFFILLLIETTDAGAGTLSYDHMPTINFAGRDFHTQVGCLAITEQVIESNDVPTIEYIEHQGFNLLPAIYARQLLIQSEDGSGEAAILFAEQIESCDQVSEAYKTRFDQQFEKFIAEVRRANPQNK
jgi:hypothetical protein